MKDNKNRGGKMRRRKRRTSQRKTIVVITVCLLLLMTTGYAAFSTSLNITVKGNIKSFYTKEGLIVWYDGQDRGKDTSLWKDKSGNNNDGVLMNINNDASSGWTDNSLILDGIDDWVNLGQMNYSNITILLTFRQLQHELDEEQALLGNWQNGGYGLTIYDGFLSASIYNQTLGEYVKAISNINMGTVSSVNNVAMTFDGTVVELFMNGSEIISVPFNGQLGFPENNNFMVLGADSNGTTANRNWNNMEVYSVFLFCINI